MGSCESAPKGIKSGTATPRLKRRINAAQKSPRKVRDTTDADKLARFATSVPGFMYSSRDFPDGDSEIVYASQGFEGVYGIPFQDGGLDFRCLIEAMHPDDVAHVVHAVERSKRQNVPLSVEHRINHPRKGIVWVEVCANFEREANGTYLWHGFVHDISERKKTEAALSESERRYRDVFDHTSDHIFIYDVVADGRFRCSDLNVAAARSLEVSREAVIGKFVEEFVPSASIEAALERLQRCSAAKVATRNEVTATLPIGERRLHFIHVPVCSDNGSVTRIIAIATDVTEEVKNRQIQYEKERYFETLVANSPDPIIRFDRDCRRVYVNRAYEKSFPLPRADMLGKTVVEASALDHENAVAFQERCKQVIETGVADEAELVFERPDGRLVAFGVRILPEREADGLIIGALAIARSITKRVVTERALRRREQEFRSLVENSTDLIVRFDRDARRIYTNPSFQRLLERVNCQSSTRPGDNKALVDPQKAIATILEVVASASHRNLQTEWREVDGSSRFFANRLEPEFAPDGSVASVLSVSHDITESVEAQRELQRREQEFRSLVENSPDMIVRYDRDARRIYMNPLMERLLERMNSQPSYWPGDNAGLVNPQILIATIHEVVASASRRELQIEWREIDGPTRCSNLRLEPEFAADGSVASVLLIAREVTEFVEAQRELQRREQEFRSLVENSPDGIVRYDREARRIYTNPSFERLLERTNPQSSLWPGDNTALVDRQKFIAAILDVVASASHRTLQTEWREADGSSRFHDIRLEPEFAPDGSVASVLSIGREITEIVKAQRELRRRENEFRTLVENSPDFIARYDRFGRRVYINPMLRRAFSHVGLEVNRLSTENAALADADGYLAMIESVVASGGGREKEVEWRDHHGTTRFGHVRFVPEFDEYGAVTGVLSIGRDITEIVLARKRIEAAASCDSLTGLPNRRDLNLRLAEYVDVDDICDAPHFALMFLDLDRFKDINDTLGHDAGDTLLFEVAARLRGCLRESDIVARFGGDEFAIFLPAAVEIDDLCGVAARVLQTFTQPFYLSGKEIFISGSIGIARYPDDTIDIDELYRYADSAMYHAKSKGRNNYQFYSAEMTARSVQRLLLEATMRKALARDEFELYFQPLIVVETGELRGAEALLRWNHPELGFLLPDKFIPVAEDTGLIVEIGNWVLATACAAAAQWNKSRHVPLRVSVNLSCRQFVMNDLVKTVRDILAANDCKAQWLELEVTESLLLEDDFGVHTALEALREMGVLIALDDFGTGYSALSYLDRFPIDVLKIDRSFVRDIEHDYKKLGLAKAIVSIAEALNLHLIAEGVEKEAQATILQGLGCRVLQGFLYGRPEPQSEFTRRLRDADLAHAKRLLRNSA